MGETNHSTPSSTDSPPAHTNGSSRRFSRRLIAVALGSTLSVAALAWFEIGTWRELERLEKEFADVNLEAFRLGMKFREGMIRLNGAVFRFQLSGDQAERSVFQEESRQMTAMMIRTKSDLLTPDEHKLVENLKTAFASYLQAMSGRLERGLKGIRKDTAGQLNQELEREAQPVLALADQLVAAQQSSWNSYFRDAESAMSAMQRWLWISLLLLVAMILLNGALLYRSIVAPLQVRLSQSRHAIQRQEKLASLGILATGVAHEIRNPLTAIKFRVFSLIRSLPQGWEDQEDLGVIQSEIQRLERIVSDFLQFARPSDPAWETVQVERLFQTVHDLLRAELAAHNIQLQINPTPDLKVRADPQQLRQVLINLVQNAADSIGRDGTVTLSANQGAAAINRGSRPMIRIDVSDTGPGIPRDVEPHLFDPFYSTKESGTGLGLPIAARILEKHHGMIEYLTRPGHGTTFSIVLPKRNHDGNENPAH